MNCAEFKNDFESWDGADDLAAPLSGPLQSHVETCTTCSRWYAELQQIDILISEHAQVHEPSPFIWTRLQARLESTEHVSPAVVSWRRFPVVAWVLASRPQVAAGICMLLLAAGTLMMQLHSNTIFQEQALGQIDIEWHQFSQTSGMDNPFSLELKSEPDGNPFDVLPTAMDMSVNPFDPVKS